MITSIKTAHAIKEIQTRANLVRDRSRGVDPVLLVELIESASITWGLSKQHLINVGGYRLNIN